LSPNHVLELPSKPPEDAKSTLAKDRAMDSKADPDFSALSDFTVWAESYATNLNFAVQAERLAQGESLSLRRREALKYLIQTDPARALQLALPLRLRDRLPASVQQNLEKRVGGRGFLGVLSADDFDTGKSEFHREVRIGSRSFEAYVYGRRASQMTQSSIFLHGIALDGLMAVHEDSVRRLEPEDPVAGGVETQNCVVCGASIVSQGTPVRADLGDRVVCLCSESHFRKLSVQIAGDEGGIHGNGRGPVQDSWSQGLKRLLYMRVAFPDDPGEPIREDEAYNLMNNVNTWYVEDSYDSTSIISDVTPLLMLPHTKDWYSVQGDTVLLADAREAARGAGFDTANYDLDIVRHNRVPGFNWNGQSYVGGKGTWLQTSSLGVTVHELGHSYGLLHANFWSATADSVIGAGSNVEYGNTFDTMGNAAAGSYQFNAIWKNRLDWLPAGFFHVVTDSGLYRLYAFDVPQLVSSWKYGLRIRKDFDRAYWAEFRQKLTQNQWTQNGILLNWDSWDNGAGNSAGGTHLLDTTPGTPAGNSSKDDSAIVIGRTFTDPSMGIHITPVAKGGTAPESWIDVQVNMGFIPSNVVPVLQLAADSTTVETNVTVTFTASASDANGDTLAYGWDFGDLTFGSNTPSASKKWLAAGEYVVRCVVSDMKGGVASRFLAVTVGSPGTYRVTGRITDATDQPLEGVRVHNGMTGSSYRGTYTDSDGNYALVNLAASSYSLGAVKYGYTLQPSGWVNPAVVNANVADLSWSGTAKPTVTLTGTDPVAAEMNLDTATVKLSRTGPTNSSLTVNYMVTGSALRELDYTLSPPLVNWPIKITLPAGVSSTNFVVTPIDDTESEGSETVVLTLAESPDYVIGPDADVTVVIQDDETAVPPTVFVSASVNDDASDDLMIEGSGDSAAFVFQRYGSTAGDLSIHYSVSGTAQNGGDYTPLSGLMTIPAGTSMATVSFNAIDDLAVEGNETVVVTLQTNTAYHVSDPNSALVTIVDDDPPMATIAATDNEAQENSSNIGRFTVTRIGNLAANLQVYYTLSGTASNGMDYGALPGAVLIPAGQATATITVTPLSDGLMEGNETVLATLVSSPTCNIGNPGTALITLMDDEWPGVTLSVSDATASEAGADTGAFTFTRTGSTNNPLTVYFDIYGTAINGADYVAISNQVTIPAGTNSAALEITPLDDLIRETGETVILVLREDPAYNRNTTSPQTIAIIDNDSGALPGVGFTVAASSGLESQTTVQLYVALSTNSSSSVIVIYSVTGGAAEGNGVDYSLSGGTLTFSPGEVSQSLYFDVNDDSLVETNETIVVSLQNPVNALLDAITNQVYTILDDDASVVTVDAASPNASESGSTPGTFRISRDGQTNEALTVSYQVTGSASSPNDYLPIGNSVTIPAGARWADIVVTPVDDPTEEPVETVTMTLLSAPKATISATQSATVFIADNDGAADLPIVSVVATDPVASCTPPDTGTFVLTRDRSTNVALTVSFTVGGTAASGVDYFAIGNSVTIPEGASAATLTVVPRGTVIAPNNKTVVATLTIGGAYRAAPALSSATVTILGAVPPSIAMQPQSQTVGCGSNATFSVAATGNPPPAYQWLFNGSNSISGATGANLTLTNVPVTSAGGYSCLVTNDYGSVTSLVAVLTVTREPLRFDTSPFALEMTSSGFRLRLLGLAGAGPIEIYASSDLAVWATVFTNPPLLGTLEFIDPMATNATQRYYRAAEIRLP
jgi:hypothetical protein